MKKLLNRISWEAVVKGNSRIEAYLQSENVSDAFDYIKAKHNLDRIKTEQMMKFL